GPARYPAPEETFAGYPTGLLEDHDRLRAVEGWEGVLPRLLERPLTSYADAARCREPAVLRAALEAARSPAPPAELDGLFPHRGSGRASVAWMLKYGLLRVVAAEEDAPTGEAPGR